MPSSSAPSTTSTPDGNWEHGTNILHRAKTLRAGRPSAATCRASRSCAGRLDASRRKLFEVRSRRVWPGRDEKMLTAWNGLMIDAFAQAGAGAGRAATTPTPPAAPPTSS